jgi:hypothetical protein
MMRSAKLLTAIVVAILVLPHPRSFAQFFPALPDLTIKTTNLKYLCVGPARLKLLLTIEIRNIGNGAAVRPSLFTPWYSVRDKNTTGPSGVRAMPPVQLSPKQAVTFEDQYVVLQQVPNPFVGGVVKTWDVAWELKVDPFNSIVESNENNNVFSDRLALVNKPKAFPPDLNPALCKF